MAGGDKLSDATRRGPVIIVIINTEISKHGKVKCFCSCGVATGAQGIRPQTLS
jgi:hypothetical protein